MVEVLEVYLSALKGYSESLRSICHDKEFAITYILKEDLVKEALDVEHLYTIINENRTKLIRFEFSDDQRRIMCHALKSYLKYLNDSINSIQEGLGVSDINLVLTQQHMQLAKEKSESLCKQVDSANALSSEGIS
jgi:hypothetical protein